MAHSIGGAYANYWSSNYPDEVEAVILVDGSQLDENAFEDEPGYTVGFGDRALAFMAKLGFGRYVIRHYSYLYPDNFSDEEQRLGDALYLRTMDSIAPVSEDGLLAQNAQAAFYGIVTNDIPKLYICASWGIQTKADLIELNKWINSQIEKNDLDMPLMPTEYDDVDVKNILDEYEKARQETIYPYAEKMGNCQVVCLPGDHMIYEQKPKECGRLIKDFIDELDG